MSVVVEDTTTPTASLPPVTDIDPGADYQLPSNGQAGSAPTQSPQFLAGQAETVPGDLNETSVRTDLAAQLISVVPCLVSVAGSVDTGNLTFTLSPGIALIGGILEVPEDITLTLGASTTTYVWLRQNGTLQGITGSTTPPVGTLSAYLGKVVTGATGATSYDISGVLRWRGGNLVRETADTSAPTDTLPSNVSIITNCPAGLYLWDGGAHRVIYTDNPVTGTGRDTSETLIHADSSHVWASMPAVATEALGGTCRTKVDLSGFNTCRLIVNQVVAGFAGSRLYMEYSTDGTTWAALSTGVLIDATGLRVSGWQTIDAPAQADVFLRLAGLGGNGVVSPEFGRISLQYRVSPTVVTDAMDAP